MSNFKKRTIIIGHYGSGKTEFAINYAVKNRCSTLVDLDVVNPYFRSSDVVAPLSELGVKVISPRFANTNVDVPSLRAEVYSAFEQDGEVVFDVGGDDDGSIVLGRFNNLFAEQPYEMLMVVNTQRPMTQSVQDITEHMHSIETVSRLKVTGFVNNTNIMEFSTVETLLNGQRIIEQLGLPIKYISGSAQILSKLPKELTGLAFPIDIYLKKPWEGN